MSDAPKKYKNIYESYEEMLAEIARLERELAEARGALALIYDLTKEKPRTAFEMEQNWIGVRALAAPSGGEGWKR